MIRNLVGLAGLPLACLPLGGRREGRADLEPESFFFPPRASFLRFIQTSITNVCKFASVLVFYIAGRCAEPNRRQGRIPLKLCFDF